jgi:type II secretory pathway pseudopilin PulG
MTHLCWKTLATAALLAGSIVTLPPTIGQAQEVLDPNQAEGGRAIDALIRAQKAYFLANNQFAATLPLLGSTVPRITPNYLQYMRRDQSGVTHYTIALKPNLKSFSGRVIVRSLPSGNVAFTSGICITDRSSLRRIPPAPTISGPVPTCPSGTFPWVIDQIQTPEESNADARQQVAAMNRRQQAYFLENNRFASTFDELGGGFSPETTSYSYSITKTDQQAFHYANTQFFRLKSSVGAVAIVQLNGQTSTVAIVCENSQPGISRPAPPIISSNQPPTCAPGTTLVGR